MASKPITVSQLNGYIKRILQLDPILGNVTVAGEISNLKFHGSGHVYFVLKDEASRINCFLPASNLAMVDFKLTEDMRVIINGYISIYERGGSYSLNVTYIRPDGIGSLAAAFEQLKRKLEHKGYFDPSKKKTVPSFPKKIAVVTSDTGAALKDILRIIKLRNNYVDILVVPCLVQGPQAAADISSALREINLKAPDADIIILGRGGGSLEDLWAFNEEAVADAIFESEIPVISAVGHETDFTISDMVADLRAQTPTEAASIAAPDIRELKKYLNDIKDGIYSSICSRISLAELKVKSNDMNTLSESLSRDIDQRVFNLEMIINEMDNSLKERLSIIENTVSKYYEVLSSLNPENLLEKGYAAISASAGGIISGIDNINIDDTVKITFKDGYATAGISDIWRK